MIRHYWKTLCYYNGEHGEYYTWYSLKLSLTYMESVRTLGLQLLQLVTTKLSLSLHI